MSERHVQPITPNVRSGDDAFTGVAHPRYFRPSHPRLLAGEHPAVADRLITRQRVDFLLAKGVTLFVDLTNPRRENVCEYRSLLRSRAFDPSTRPIHLSFPISDGGVPSSIETATAMLDAIDAGLSNGETVYLHCKAGIGRTGSIAALHLMRHGLTGSQALRALARSWKRDPRSRVVHRCPETSVQLSYVRNWPQGA